MTKSPLSSILLALGVIALSGSLYAQDAKKAPAKAAPKAAAEAPAKAAAPEAPAKDGAAKEMYPQSHFDFLLKERIASGQAQDSPQLRELIRDELINRELVMREAQQMAWQQLPVNVKPVLPGTLPVLRWFAEERGFEGDVETGIALW